jgi:hypothetical protein
MRRKSRLGQPTLEQEMVNFDASRIVDPGQRALVAKAAKQAARLEPEIVNVRSYIESRKIELQAEGKRYGEIRDILEPDRMHLNDLENQLMQARRAIRMLEESISPVLERRRTSGGREMPMRSFQEQLRVREQQFAQAERDGNAGLYTASVLSVKADPFGRYYLMDTRYDDEVTRLYLSGTQRPIAMASVYTDKSEEYGDHFRQHGGPGARVKGAGLGAIAYMMSAFCARYWESAYAEGTASPQGGENFNRTNDASKVWRGMRENKTSTVSCDEESGSGEHCAHVSGDTIYLGDDREGTITSDEICGEVDYEAEVCIDYLSWEAVLHEPFVVFAQDGSVADDGDLPVSVDTAARRLSNFSSEWIVERTSDGRFQAKTNGQVAQDPNEEEAFRPYFDDDGNSIVSKETCELLLRAYHGDSLFLTFAIADLLKRSGSEDMMVAYLTRADIGSRLRDNQRAMELMGQRRLPGLSGLSGTAHREVMQAVRLSNLAQAAAVNPGNPFNFPKLSARLARKLARFDFEE